MPKKGKIFAAKDAMLKIIDQVNGFQDEKIRQLQEKDLELLKRMAQREASLKQKRESKGDRLKEIKDRLKKGKTGRKGRGNEERDDKEEDNRKTGKAVKGRDAKKKPAERGNNNKKIQNKTTNNNNNKTDKKKKSVSFKQ